MENLKIFLLVLELSYVNDLILFYRFKKIASVAAISQQRETMVTNMKSQKMICHSVLQVSYVPIKVVLQAYKKRALQEQFDLKKL